MVSSEIAKYICRELINGSLQCKICFKFLFPCWQCPLGHTMCWTCHRKVLRCPFCRTDRSDTVLCPAVFNIASKFLVSCGMNCGYKEFPYKMMNHLSECSFVLYKCPTTILQPNSSIKATRQGICEHFIKKHSNLLIRRKTATFLIPSNFILHIWMNLDMNLYILTLSLMFYGPERERLNYQCLITVTSLEDKKMQKIISFSPYIENYHEILEIYKAPFRLFEEKEGGSVVCDIRAKFEIIDNTQ